MLLQSWLPTATTALFKEGSRPNWPPDDTTPPRSARTSLVEVEIWIALMVVAAGPVGLVAQRSRKASRPSGSRIGSRRSSRAHRAEVFVDICVTAPDLPSTCS